MIEAGGEELMVRAWGGDQMQAAGAEVVKHYRELAFMGFTQVLLNLRTILGNIKACKADILSFKPDAIILIDYPGFNLRSPTSHMPKASRCSTTSVHKFGLGRLVG